MDAKQIAAIELAMAEEHKRDKEALDRLKRFIGNGATGTNGHSSKALPVQFEIPQVEDMVDDVINNGTIRSRVAEVFAADPERRWTIPTMLQYLKSVNYPLHAQKPEVTLSGAFRRLNEIGKIKRVRRGHGRNPHVYKAITEEELSGKSEEK